MVHKNKRKSSDKSVKRLYSEFKPDHYVLKLEPDRENMKFSGSVIIAGHKTGRPSRRITLHQHGLRITSAQITRHDRSGDHNIEVDRINNHSSFDEVRLHASQMLYPGSYTIAARFSGHISDAMNGIYPCYFKHQSKEKKLIATQFESHYAREVFPCIDEPEAKATFDLTLTVPPGETVVSNTPVKKQVNKNKSLEVSFETTPKMSTYLLAFVYGEMGYQETKTSDGVVVRAYATPDNVEYTDFALDVAVKCLEFYNNYFGIPYPLEKCDLIALPDFASGAMENWGCITFREQALLVDPKNSTLVSKQYVAMVVAHELAHMWFGNLVTMRWWTDLWLNEGFASWVEYLAIDHIFPEWEMWTQFTFDEQQQALKLDALEHTHPIEVPINHPDEIRTIFDAISYSKGSSVIHMLHEYLGPDFFREGLSFYLAKHNYANTDTTDLWAAFEEASGKPVKEFMRQWTGQPGFPIIKANIDEMGIKLEQERFYMNPAARRTKHDPWPIPLLAHQRQIPEITNSQSLKIETKQDGAVKLNRGQSGYYRVIYNVSHLRRLGEQIAEGKLAPIDRLGILSDQFEAAKAGQADTAESFKFLEFFKDESNAAVWDVISSSLAHVRMVMDDEELRENMKPYVRKLTSKQLQRLGWDVRPDESHFDRLLRPTILNMSSVAEEPAVVKKALELFKKMHEPDDIKPDLRTGVTGSRIRRVLELDPDLRGVVYGTAVRHGGKAEFEKLLAMHDSTHLSEERTIIASALTGFKQPELIKRSLELVTSPKVRKQDVAYWISYSFMNRYAKRLTWQWLKDNWHWLSKNLGGDLSFYRMPIYAARSFSDGAFLQEFNEYFADKKTPALKRSILQGQEIIESQVAWRDRDLKVVKTFFSSS